MIELLTVMLAVDGKEFFENPAYLLGIPLLGDYLEEGLSQLGYSCGD